MKTITENYETRTKDELLKEVQQRGLEGVVTEASLKSEIITALETNDKSQPATPKTAGSTDKKGKRKRRSRGLRNLDTALNRLTRSGSKLATAVDDGFETYRDERKKSSEKKKDGALRDFVDNVADGVSKAQKKSGGATKDLLTIFCTKRTKKRVRRAAKNLGSFVPFIR
jgi:hypothetical protein